MLANQPNAIHLPIYVFILTVSLCTWLQENFAAKCKVALTWRDFSPGKFPLGVEWKCLEERGRGLPGVGVAVIDIWRETEAKTKTVSNLPSRPRSPPSPSRRRRAPTLRARRPLPAVLADAGEGVASSHARPSVLAGSRVARAVLG